MAQTIFDVVVIGAGQSGLASGYYLKQAGLRFVILEKGEVPTGSWPQYYESLKLFSPAAYSSLPGYPFPHPPGHYPTRNEVADYLKTYAKTFALPILTKTAVKQVTKQENSFVVESTNKTFLTKTVIVASGSFNKPHYPRFSQQHRFAGTILHSSAYKRPNAFVGQRVIIVGGGNSAIQIAAELSEVAQVTVATRQPLRFFPQTILGYDVHVWLRKTGADFLPVGERENRPIIDTGQYRQALRDGKFARRPLFKQFTTTGVIWADDIPEPIDTVILATGYRPTLDYLSPLNVLKPNGFPQQKRGVAQQMPGLYFVGIPGQRNAASATLRGAGADARYVVKQLQHYLERTTTKPKSRFARQKCSCQLACC